MALDPPGRPVETEMSGAQPRVSDSASAGCSPRICISEGECAIEVPWEGTPVSLSDVKQAPGPLMGWGGKTMGVDVLGLPQVPSADQD